MAGAERAAHRQGVRALPPDRTEGREGQLRGSFWLKSPGCSAGPGAKLTPPPAGQDNLQGGISATNLGAAARTSLGTGAMWLTLVLLAALLLAD